MPRPTLNLKDRFKVKDEAYIPFVLDLAPWAGPRLVVVRAGMEVRMGVQVTIRFFEGCPNWELAEQRVTESVRRLGLEDVRIHQEALSTTEAERNLTGSPTILVGGRDLFPETATSGPTCRVYPTPEGLRGAPTVEQLLAALSKNVPETGG